MLEKPGIAEEKIIDAVEAEYGLKNAHIEFLPLGADLNTAVYRAAALNGTLYFLKLRKGAFDKTSVELPKYYYDQGIQEIIPPLKTTTGRLYGKLDRYKTILYPFIEGRNAYEVNLTDDHWREFGAALKRIHLAHVPDGITARIQRETCSPKWRELVRSSIKLVKERAFDEPVAVKVAGLLKEKDEEIQDLVERTERLAQRLQSQPPELIVCHSDLHAGNILIAENGSFYIVDWDAPTLAPKERDLMYPGGGQFANRRSPNEEEDLFYQGYGQTDINPDALAYYRYERIIEDIAVYCEQLLLSDEGGEDREQAYKWLLSNFQPGNTIEIARQSDRSSI